MSDLRLIPQEQLERMQADMAALIEALERIERMAINGEPDISRVARAAIERVRG